MRFRIVHSDLSNQYYIEWKAWYWPFWTTCMHPNPDYYLELKFSTLEEAQNVVKNWTTEPTITVVKEYT